MLHSYIIQKYQHSKSYKTDEDHVQNHKSHFINKQNTSRHLVTLCKQLRNLIHTKQTICISYSHYFISGDCLTNPPEVEFYTVKEKYSVQFTVKLWLPKKKKKNHHKVKMFESFSRIFH